MTERLGVLIVDDEAPARDRMRRLLGASALRAFGIEIVAEASDGVAALEAIEKAKPDVVFLDIEMPELDGLGVAQALSSLDRPPAVIFVTAYDEHALKAFELAAVDYLVKPVNEARLRAALGKVAERLRASSGKESAPARALGDGAGAVELERLARSIAPARGARRLAVRSGAKFVVFDPAKVSAVIARDHYAAIQVDGRELLADDTLDELIVRLDPERFLRIHRSAIVNVEFLHELEREGDRRYVAVLADSKRTRIPVARERLAELKARLGLE